MIYRYEDNSAEYNEEYAKAKSMVLRWLSYRQRSKKEISDYLAGKGFDQSIIAALTEYLTEMRYIDDVEYARMCIEYGLRNGKGSLRIEYELRNKGISSIIAQEMMESICNDEALYKSAVKAVKSKLPGEYDRRDQKIWNKAGRFLESRGFPIHITYKVLNYYFDI